MRQPSLRCIKTAWVVALLVLAFFVLGFCSAMAQAQVIIYDLGPGSTTIHGPRGTTTITCITTGGITTCTRSL